MTPQYSHSSFPLYYLHEGGAFSAVVVVVVVVVRLSTFDGDADAKVVGAGGDVGGVDGAAEVERDAGSQRRAQGDGKQGRVVHFHCECGGGAEGEFVGESEAGLGSGRGYDLDAGLGPRRQ